MDDELNLITVAKPDSIFWMEDLEGFVDSHAFGSETA